MFELAKDPEIGNNSTLHIAGEDACARSAPSVPIPRAAAPLARPQHRSSTA